MKTLSDIVTHNETIKPFWQWTPLSQYHLVLHDDLSFTETKKQMKPWIENACFYHLTDISFEDRQKLYANLLLDIEEYAKDYLEGRFFQKGFSFASYFVTTFEERANNLYDTGGGDLDDDDDVCEDE